MSGGLPKRNPVVAGSRARFEKRARRTRRAPIVGLAALVAGALAVLGAIWAVGFSSLFAVTDVRVTGVDEAEQQTIVAAARVPLGTPLIRVDTGAIAQRVGDERKPIKSVTVTRQYPHTVVIQAVPRVPALVLKDAKGQLEVVDDGGLAYAVVPSPPAGVPVVTTSQAGAEKEGLRAALAALAAFPAERRAGISEVHVSGATLVTFTLDKTKIVWGGMGDEARKVRIIEVLMGMKPVPGTVDVSAPEMPTTR